MTRFVVTEDGKRIAYNCSGNGLGLVFLHGGFIQDRSIWTELSYVNSLQNEYTVVAIDIRGHGESSKPKDERAYSIESLISDIELVVDSIGLEKYFIWGFSLGASIGLHASIMQKLLGVVVAGSFFGQELIDYGKQNISSLEATLQARDADRLDDLQLSPEEIFFANNADLDVALAISKAMAAWPKIEPGMVKSPLMIYAGKNDEPTYSILKKQFVDIQQSGIELHLIEGLDHFQAISKKEVVLPIVKSFFSSCLT